MGKNRDPNKSKCNAARSLVTLERRQHDIIEYTRTDKAAQGATVERVVTQRVIDRLLRRRRVNDRQYDAATRLLRTWWRAKVVAGTPKTRNLEADHIAGDGQADPEGLSQAMAREEYDAAMNTLTRSQRRAVEMIVIWDYAPDHHIFDDDNSRRRTPRIGTLGRALDGLVRHYRL